MLSPLQLKHGYPSLEVRLRKWVTRVHDLVPIGDPIRCPNCTSSLSITSLAHKKCPQCGARFDQTRTRIYVSTFYSVVIVTLAWGLILKLDTLPIALSRMIAGLSPGMARYVLLIASVIVLPLVLQGLASLSDEVGQNIGLRSNSAANLRGLALRWEEKESSKRNTNDQGSGEHALHSALRCYLELMSMHLTKDASAMALSGVYARSHKCLQRSNSCSPDVRLQLSALIFLEALYSGDFKVLPLVASDSNSFLHELAPLIMSPSFESAYKALLPTAPKLALAIVGARAYFNPGTAQIVESLRANVESTQLLAIAAKLPDDAVIEVRAYGDIGSSESARAEMSATRAKAVAQKLANRVAALKKKDGKLEVLYYSTPETDPNEINHCVAYCTIRGSAGFEPSQECS